MTDPTLNPMSLKDTAKANGQDVPDDAMDAVGSLVDIMNGLSPEHRLVMFQVLTDFFCPRCGVVQPPGDCQCEQ